MCVMSHSFLKQPFSKSSVDLLILTKLLLCRTIRYWEVTIIFFSTNLLKISENDLGDSLYVPDTRNLRSSPPPASPEGLSSLHTPDGSCASIRLRDTRCAPLWLRVLSLGLPRGWERVVYRSAVLVHSASSSSWTFALISWSVYLPGMSSGREISILIKVVWTRWIQRRLCMCFREITILPSLIAKDIYSILLMENL